MKVLLYSHFFYPSVGGLESVSLTLATAFAKNNIACKVVTITPADTPDTFPFSVHRNPGTKEQIELVKWADVVLYNGASLALQPWVLLYRKAFVWVHTGYQASCVDGCGWVEGESAPITPLASVLYHLKRNGLVAGLKGATKLSVKRLVAKYLVSRNVAITKWMLNAQPLPNQVHIYNPFPIESFKKPVDSTPLYDFLFLGRLVSEKGISTLLKAFAEVLKRTNTKASLLIIGDGNWKSKMEKLAEDLRIRDKVTFAGRKTGDDLIETVAKGSIAVIPSEWYEPMGGVALELMAAGKNLIVSETGGLKECVGNAGLTFPNGNYKALADCMVKLLQNNTLRNEQLTLARERVKSFAPSIFVAQYINLLQELTADKIRKTETFEAINLDSAY